MLSSVRRYSAALLVGAGTLTAICFVRFSMAQTARAQQSPEQAAIVKQMSGLRDVPDDKRGAVTRQLALDIRALKQPGVRVGLAYSLANLATEGDFGKQALQEVAATLAEALREEPTTKNDGSAYNGPRGEELI